jgi:hypothetical protein
MRTEPGTRREVMAGDVLQFFNRQQTATAASAAAAIPAINDSVKTAASDSLISPRVLVALVMAGECLLVMIIGLGLWLGYPGARIGSPDRYIPVILGASLALGFVAQFAGLYSLQTLLRPIQQMTKLSAIWALLFAALAALAFFTKV